MIDWKSDVNPAPETIEHYRAQIRNYLQATELAQGLLVFVTSGLIVAVGASKGLTSSGQGFPLAT